MKVFRIPYLIRTTYKIKFVNEYNLLPQFEVNLYFVYTVEALVVWFVDVTLKCVQCTLFSVYSRVKIRSFT